MSYLNSKNKKILIVTYEMIPFANNWGGCQRMYYLARDLNERNYDVWTISCKISSEEKFFDQSINFNQVFINNPIAPTRSLVTLNGGIEKNNLNFKLKYLVRRLLNKIDAFFFNEPNKGIGIISYFWLIKSLGPLKRIINENYINMVIFSGPPFTLFYLAKKVKKINNRLKIVMDYRDPWNLWNNRRFPTFYLEKHYLKFADLIITTTDNLTKELQHTFGVSNCHTIYNGFSEKAWSKIDVLNNKLNNKIIISYVGSIDFKKGSYRDTTEFFKAYDSIKDKNLIELRFIGINNSDEVNKLIIKYPEIKFIPKVTPKESLEYIMQSDYLLSLHTTKDESAIFLMGGKIFDYLRSGNTIISINNPNSFEHKFLTDKNAMLCTNDHQKILEVFNTVLKNKNGVNKKMNSFEQIRKKISSYSRENQNNHYIELIEILYK